MLNTSAASNALFLFHPNILVTAKSRPFISTNVEMLLFQRQSPLELAPPGVTPNYIDPVSRGPELVRVSIALVSLAAVFVATRFIVKIFMTKSPALDDVFSLAALVSLPERWRKVEPAVNSLLIRY